MDVSTAVNQLSAYPISTEIGLLNSGQQFYRLTFAYDLFAANAWAELTMMGCIAQVVHVDGEWIVWVLDRQANES